MANEWKDGLFVEIAEVVMGQSPPGEDCNDNGHGLPLLNGPTEFGSHHPVPVQFTTNAKKVCQPGDLLFCVRGSTTGRMNWADQKYAIGRGIAAIRHREGPELHPFLKASVDMSLPVLLAAATGSTFPNVSKGQIEEMSIPIPPLPEQRAIAHVLGTLDDKIECNRRLNRTLEGIVRALFKSWFIDFDPVIDNALAAGNPIPDELADRATLRQQAAEEHAKPLPDDLRALFPAEFTHTETMGWIPKGWEVAPLSTLARLNPHAWTARNAPKRVRYIDLANTKNGSINDVVEYSFDAAPSRARRILYPGDTVFGTVRPGNRSFAYIHEEGLTGSTGFAVLHPLREAYQEFIYLATTRDEIVDLFAHLADGAAYPAVRAEVVIEQVHAMPPTRLIEAFHHSVATEIVTIGQRSAQNHKLSTLRNTLLPKLLTGEVTVPVAATLAEEAGQ